MEIIFKAGVSEKLLVTELSINIYQEYYLYLWHDGGAEWYMEKYAYEIGKIAEELENENIEYLILVDDGQPIGYMKIVLNAKLAGHETMDCLEIERIYLYEKAKGKGLGKKLMGVALKKARDLKKEIVFLKAMDSSTDVIEFYKRMGYSICGRAELPLPEFSLMKKEFRGMVILKRNVF